MSSSYLSRGIDHLGDLGAKLRDLQGYRTLAYELIQNADDARESKSVTFDVSQEALIVDNDGVFSDCGKVGRLIAHGETIRFMVTAVTSTVFERSPPVTKGVRKEQPERLELALSLFIRFQIVLS